MPPMPVSVSRRVPGSASSRSIASRSSCRPTSGVPRRSGALGSTAPAPPRLPGAPTKRSVEQQRQVVGQQRGQFFRPSRTAGRTPRRRCAPRRRTRPAAGRDPARLLDVDEPRPVAGQPVFVLEARDRHRRRHPAVALPVQADEDLRLLQVGAVKRLRRMRPARPARTSPGVRCSLSTASRAAVRSGASSLQRRADEYAQSLVGVRIIEARPPYADARRGSCRRSRTLRRQAAGAPTQPRPLRRMPARQVAGRAPRTKPAGQCPALNAVLVDDLAGDDGRRVSTRPLDKPAAAGREVVNDLGGVKMQATRVEHVQVRLEAFGQDARDRSVPRPARCRCSAT